MMAEPNAEETGVVETAVEEADTTDKARNLPGRRYNKEDFQPAGKRRKLVAERIEKEKIPPNVIAEFTTPDGQSTGQKIEIPSDIGLQQLNELINQILNNDEKLPYSFFINNEEVRMNLKDALVNAILNNASENKSEDQIISLEKAVRIIYHPQALFRVRPVSRCTATLPGHTEAVLSIAFSPDGRRLATGSGDATVRLWDIDTETPIQTLRGHTHWILALAWSPDGKRLASGDKNSEIRVWNGDTGKKITKVLKNHSKWITSLCWEPFHLNPQCTRFASASKDSTIKVWDGVRGTCLFSLSGHTMCVTCVKWGGEGLIFSSSEDRTIKVWNMMQNGQLVRTLQGHGHWVNTMALNTDYVLRTGPFDHTCQPIDEANLEGARKAAEERYRKTKGKRPERLVTGSDDYTLYIWEPSSGEKPIARMTGHQAIVNQVNFSPDGLLIASASFDKSIRLWDASTGKFVGMMRGHVGAVYQVCWSGDSRLIGSCSKDSTAKVWDVATRKLRTDLPGHSDEVYAIDWSPDGERVCSGGKDRVVKIWRS